MKIYTLIIIIGLVCIANSTPNCCAFYQTKYYCKFAENYINIQNNGTIQNQISDQIFDFTEFYNEGKDEFYLTASFNNIQFNKLGMTLGIDELIPSYNLTYNIHIHNIPKHPQDIYPQIVLKYSNNEIASYLYAQITPPVLTFYIEDVTIDDRGRLKSYTMYQSYPMFNIGYYHNAFTYSKFYCSIYNYSN